jgi:hypothetical protein
MKNKLIVYCLFLFASYSAIAQEVYVPISKEQQAVIDLTNLLGKDRSAVEQYLGSGQITDMGTQIMMNYPDKGIRFLIGGSDKEMVVNYIFLIWKKKEVGHNDTKYKPWKLQFSLDDLDEWFGQYEVKSEYNNTYEHPDFNVEFNCKGYRSYHDDEVTISHSPSYQKRPKRTTEQYAAHIKANKAYEAILDIAKANDNKASKELFEEAKDNDETTNTFISYMSMNDGKIIEGYKIYLYGNNKVWVEKNGKNLGGYIEVKMFSDETGENKVRRIMYHVLEDGKETPFEFAIVKYDTTSNYPFLIFFGEGDYYLKFRGKVKS